MIRRVNQLLSTSALLVWLTAAVAQPQAPQLQLQPAPRPDGLETAEFFSPAVGRTMKFDIVLPPDYQDSDDRYPVLYLLHGYMQNYTIWGRNLGAAFYARNLGDLILVLPDGGNTWFVNYAASDDGRSHNWEDYLIEDLIQHIDSSYRTVASREGRAIAGLSMGGYAAFTLALRHPDLFVSMGSTSGALSHARTATDALRQGIDLRPRARTPQMQSQIAQADEFIAAIIDIPGFSTQLERTPSGLQFETPEQAAAYDPFEIIYNVPKSQLPHIYLDAGTEDSLISEAREFVQILMLNNVPFDFMQERGRHNAEFWRRSVGHMMTIQHEVMQRALGRRP
jgi:S-formylglutathione hydrolase FrmB